MNRTQTTAACFAALALLCFLGPYLDDLDDRQAVADDVRAAQVDAQQVAIAERQQHPSTTLPPSEVRP